MLLDSNIVIELLSGNKEIADKLNKLETIYIPTTVLGELYVGAYRVSNSSKQIKMIESFIKLCTVLETDTATAKYYGEIVAKLYKKGKPIPTNDIWTAATAQQYDLTIATMDKHFKEIENISVKYW